MSQWLTAAEIITLTGYKSSRRRISVTVWGQAYEVKVYQKSKAVWEAAGSYDGESIAVPGSSESSAIRHWEETARYRG